MTSYPRRLSMNNIHPKVQDIQPALHSFTHA